MLEKSFLSAVRSASLTSESDAMSMIDNSVAELALSDEMSGLDAILGSIVPFEWGGRPLVMLEFLNSTVCFKDRLMNYETLKKHITIELDRVFNYETAVKLIENL